MQKASPRSTRRQTPLPRLHRSQLAALRWVTTSVGAAKDLAARRYVNAARRRPVVVAELFKGTVSPPLSGE